MAASETQFQSPGLQASGYTPVVGGNLGGSHLFGGSGQIWAGIGQTALDAAKQFGQTAQMIQASPLNPAVKAAQDYQVAQEQAAKDHVAWVQAQGRAGQAVEETGPTGLSTVPFGSTGINPMVGMKLMAGPQKQTPPPPAPAEEQKKPDGTPLQSDFQLHPENYIQNPATGSYERRKDAPPLDSTPAKPAAPAKSQNTNPGDLLSSTNVPSQGGSTTSLSAGGTGILNTGQGQSSDIEAVPAAQYRAQQQQGGNIWSPQRPAPAAPPAPNAQPSTPGTVPGSLSDQYAQQAKAQDMSLANWQNQNQTEPMTAQDAMNWMKRKTTLAQDATYLPHGGPAGPNGQPEPAYAFHMKGGGVNTVPISQMVKDGGGPIVASQNTSQVLSQSDRLQQQQQNAMTAPPDQSQQPPPGQPAPNISPPPPANLPGTNAPNISGPPPSNLPPSAPTGPAQPQDQQYPNISGPPPAPGLAAARQPLTDISGNPISAYANVASRGGLQPQYLSAGGEAPPANPTVTATSPAIKTDTPVPQIDASDAQDNIFSKGYSKDQLAKMPEDPTVSDYGGFTWKQDRQFRNFYAVMRSTNNIFREQRYNWGQGNWVDMPTDKSGNQQELHDAVAATPGDKMKLSDEQIRDMPIDQIMSALDLAKRYKATGGDPQGVTANHIQGEINQSQSLARQIEILEKAKAAGIDPSEYSQNAVDQSKAAADRDAIMPKEIGPLIPVPGMNIPSVTLPGGLQTMPMKGIGVNPWDALRWGVGKWDDLKADHGPVHPIADELTKEARYFGTQMSQTPGLAYTGEGRPENRGTTFEIGGVPIHLPGGTDISPLQQVSRIFQGQPADDVIKGLKQVKFGIDKDLGTSVDLAKRLNFRTSPDWEKAADSVKNKQNIADDTPRFDVGKSAIQTVDLTKSGALDDFIKKHGSGTQFYDQQGNLQRIK